MKTKTLNITTCKQCHPNLVGQFAREFGTTVARSTE